MKVKTTKPDVHLSLELSTDELETLKKLMGYNLSVPEYIFEGKDPASQVALENIMQDIHDALSAL